jgi:hypothetical protein
MKATHFLAISAILHLFAVRPAFAQTSVTTYHNDPQRTGWNSHETILTPAMVASSFGYITTVPLDDQVDTQPLVVPNVTIPGAGVHTVVYVTTEGNTVYALDSVSGAVLKSRNLGTPIPKPQGCANNGPNVGINGTGTIDVASNTFYVMVYSSAPGGPQYNLHALDLATLADHAGSPVLVNTTLSLHGGAAPFAFNASVQRQRPGLLDANGRVYAGFGSFCDFVANQSRGMLLSWDKTSLALQSGPELTDRQPTSNTVDCTYPGNHPCFLSSIWMSGFGVSTDSGGNIYFTTGNTASGTYDGTFNIAESAVKMSSSLAPLSLFTPSDVNTLDTNDTDYGSGGLLVLPDQTGAFPHLAVAAGKEGKLFMLNRDSMGGLHSPDIPQSVPIGDCWCGPSYFETSAGPRIVSSGGTQMQLWSINSSGAQPSLSAVASAPPIETSVQDGGFFTSVSSNGTTAGSAVIWAVGRASGSDLHVTLYAYNATPSGGTLPLLWSGVAGSWPNKDGNSNIVPTVANGKVYVASNKELLIFGQRPPNDVTIWRYTGTPCVGTSCPGWQQLDDNTKTVAIVSDGNLYQLHNDGMIWKSTGTPCDGVFCPGWQLLDDNTKTVNIAADGGNLYQLHNDGMIWKYTGTPCSGTSCPGWQMLDNNTKAAAIAAGGSSLYELHNDGMIWRYTGTPCTGTSCPGWQMLDDNTKTVAIAADGGNLYQLHNDGMIWRFTGTACSGTSCPGWQMLDNNTKAAAIASSGGNLYELHNDGMIWHYTGTPCSGSSCPGWQMLDDNTKSVAIRADGSGLYQLHNDGMIWKYTGTACSGTSCPGWQMLDDNTRTTQIASGGGQLNQLHDGLLYQLHKDGSIWRYTGAGCQGSSCPGWQMLDDNTRTVAVTAAGRQLFQLHKDGTIWRYTGTPCAGASCPGWQMLDNNPQALAIAGGDQLFQLHKDGSIWRYTGTPCAGSSCPGWQELDNNPQGSAIAGGDQLYQFHTDGSIWRYTGTPCAGASCPGWQELDNNPQGKAVAASYMQ